MPRDTNLTFFDDLSKSKVVSFGVFKLVDLAI